MFPKHQVTGVTKNGITTAYNSPQSNNSYATRVLANISQGAHGMSVNSSWSSQYQYYMSGLLPAEPGLNDSSSLALFYRDCYLFDNTAGSVVDIQSSFPFSEFNLRGLETKELQVYEDAVAQLDVLRMMPIISTSYLVDGFSCSSLVFDGKRYTDTLMHDALQCSVTPSPFFNMQPEVRVTANATTLGFLNTDSPFTRDYRSSLPADFVAMLGKSTFILNPVNTMFIARRSLTDRAYVSFLHRILPMYLLEKTLFKGTLVEATRRQRAMTHVTGGDDTWTPSTEELDALVSAFQAAEADPLGGWIATRSGISASDLRPGGDFWKWTDTADVLVPYKLRALGSSESFLSGDASYAAAESAYSTFLETQNAYRNHLTHAVFYSTLFPIVAVANDLYKDKNIRADKSNVTRFLLDSSKRSNLKIPKVVWHKSLEAKDEENAFDLLEQASEKGVPIPIKAWMAAAHLDADSLKRDLAEDQKLRADFKRLTGKDTSHEGEDMVTAARKRLTTQSLRRGVYDAKVPLLARDFGDAGDVFSLSRTGKKKWVHNARTKDRVNNARIAKISARALRDEAYRIELAERNRRKLGRTTVPNIGEFIGKV